MRPHMLLRERPFKRLGIIKLSPHSLPQRMMKYLDFRPRFSNLVHRDLNFLPKQRWNSRLHAVAKLEDLNLIRGRTLNLRLRFLVRRLPTRQKKQKSGVLLKVLGILRKNIEIVRGSGLCTDLVPHFSSSSIPGLAQRRAKKRAKRDITKPEDLNALERNSSNKKPASASKCRTGSEKKKTKLPAGMALLHNFSAANIGQKRLTVSLFFAIHQNT
jgi:hypothetical protein